MKNFFGSSWVKLHPTGTPSRLNQTLILQVDLGQVLAQTHLDPVSVFCHLQLQSRILSCESSPHPPLHPGSVEPPPGQNTRPPQWWTYRTCWNQSKLSELKCLSIICPEWRIIIIKTSLDLSSPLSSDGLSWSGSDSSQCGLKLQLLKTNP